MEEIYNNSKFFVKRSHWIFGGDGWKAWDVTIEGISYVKSFREDFGAEIDGKGLDAVIAFIRERGMLG